MTPDTRKKRRLFKSARRRLKGRLLYLGALKARLLFRLLPRSAALALAGTIGRAAHSLLGRERRLALKNLETAFGGEMSPGELEETVRQVFVHQAKNLADFLRGTKINQSNFESVISTEGIEHLKGAYDKGRGVIAITGHIGNWEIMGAWVSLAGYRLSVIGRRLNYPALNRLLIRTREAWDMEAIDRDRAVKPLLKAISGGRVIGILIDQDTRLDGVWVPFFGQPTHTPTGPINVAYRTGAAIVPMAIHRRPDNGYLIMIHPEVTFDEGLEPREAVERMTAKLSGILEEFIRREPSQWVWMHRRWRRPPESEE